MTDTTPQRVQAALLQLDNYGPWTVTPEPRREPELQALQARLYADFADFVGGRDGYVFYGRFDNMVALGGALDRSAYARFQTRVENRYPVTASIGVGHDETPAAALGAASGLLQEAGSAQDGDRREVLAVDGPVGATGVTVAHFDVVDATGTYTDRDHAYDVELVVREVADTLSRYMRTEHDSLSYFVGGDNVIAVCPDLSAAAFDRAVEHVHDRTGVRLQVGFGRGTTAVAAGTGAKHALETCREADKRVSAAPAASD
ncbi:MAG: GTP cyclohydrolase IIa [Salinirussus sp.]